MGSIGLYPLRSHNKHFRGEIMGASNGSAVLPKAICTRIPDALGMASATNGSEIFYDDRLNDIQRKCAIVHELIHVERGHFTKQREPVEMAVRFEAARRLIPSMTGRCSEEPTLAKAAEAMTVTRRVLMDRAATLTDSEVSTAGCASCRLCPVMAARFDTTPPPSVEQWQERVQWA